MEIYNKGHRDFIVARKDIVKLPDGVAEPLNKKFHIKPEMVVEVEDKRAEALMKQYPLELKQWGKK